MALRLTFLILCLNLGSIAYAMDDTDFQKSDDIEDRRLEGDDLKSFAKLRRFFVSFAHSRTSAFSCEKVKAVADDLKTFGKKLEEQKPVSAYFLSDNQDTQFSFFDDYKSRQIDSQELAKKLSQDRSFLKEGPSCYALTNDLIGKLERFSTDYSMLGKSISTDSVADSWNVQAAKGLPIGRTPTAQ